MKRDMKLIRAVLIETENLLDDDAMHGVYSSEHFRRSNSLKNS